MTQKLTGYKPHVLAKDALWDGWIRGFSLEQKHEELYQLTGYSISYDTLEDLEKLFQKEMDNFYEKELKL